VEKTQDEAVLLSKIKEGLEKIGKQGDNQEDTWKIEMIKSKNASPDKMKKLNDKRLEAIKANENKKIAEEESAKLGGTEGRRPPVPGIN